MHCCFDLSLGNPIQEKSFQIFWSIIKINNKKHISMKNSDSEKKAKKITNCCFRYIKIQGPQPWSTSSTSVPILFYIEQDSLSAVSLCE